MLRLVAGLTVLLLLSACAQLGEIRKEIKQSIVTPDERAYADTLDTFALTHRVSLLRSFQQDYPDSIWSRRAETLALYALEVERRKIDNREDQELIEKQAIEIERLLVREKKLKKQNAQLTEQIDQLKGLLIQLEQRTQ